MVESTGQRRAGMREVADDAGVSTSTVANVLSRPAIVAAGTRRRVEEAMERLGYVPNGPARQLRGVPSTIVGSLTLDLANPFYAELNRGIEDRLAETGCLLVACSTDLQPEKERRLLNLLRQQAVRGIIISPIIPDLAPLEEISRRGTPVVLVDPPRADADLCAVTVNHVLGGQLVGEHLLSLGHRRVAFLRGTGRPDSVDARCEGLREALAAGGLDPAEALVDLPVSLQGPDSAEAIAAAVQQLRSAAVAPTAVVCVNDAAAVGLLTALADAGLRVPEDISVVGYDDLPFTARLSPPLTTVAQPKRELGDNAAVLLLDEARPGHTHSEIRFRPRLVVRSSTAPPRF